MNAFVNRFCEKYGLKEADFQLLFREMEAVYFAKGDLIVREGERNTHFYLLEKGVWRAHYLSDGVDVSLWFASAGEPAFSSWGFVDNAASLISIESMCDSSAYFIPKQRLEELYHSSAVLANLGRKLFERQFLDLENWMVNGGSPRAKERYLTLLEENPGLLQYVPLKYIASYLWVTPQSLSRIRAGLAKKKKC